MRQDDDNVILRGGEGEKRGCAALMPGMGVMRAVYIEERRWIRSRVSSSSSLVFFPFKPFSFSKILDS